MVAAVSDTSSFFAPIPAPRDVENFDVEQLVREYEAHTEMLGAELHRLGLQTEVEPRRASFLGAYLEYFRSVITYVRKLDGSNYKLSEGQHARLAYCLDELEEMHDSVYWGTEGRQAIQDLVDLEVDAHSSH